MNFFTVLLAANPQGFFDSMKSSVLLWVNSGLDGFLIPVLVIVLAIAVIVCLAVAAFKWNERSSEEFKKPLIGAVVCAIIITILLTKNVWWAFLTGGVG